MSLGGHHGGDFFGGSNAGDGAPCSAFALGIVAAAVVTIGAQGCRAAPRHGSSAPWTP